MISRRPLSLLCLLLSTPVARAGVVTILADRDQTLFESDTGCCSNGAGVYFFAGDRNDGLIDRGLVHFDVASAIPAGSTIVSVRLDLNLSRSRAGDELMTLHRVQQDWGEGASATGTGPGTQIGQGAPAAAGDATWIHTFAPGSTWTTPGGDYDAQPSASLLMGGASGIGVQSFSSTTMVAEVQSWLEDRAANFGWLLRAADEGGSRSARRFDTRETGDPAITPRIEVRFTGPVGSAYCVATANSTGATATLSASGCLVAAEQLLTLRAEGLPAHAPGLFFYGSTQIQTAFGDGFLCAGGSTTRLYPPTSADAAGVVQRALDFGLPSAGGIASGANLNFQHWYRDPAAQLSGYNLSDGLNLVFQ